MDEATSSQPLTKGEGRIIEVSDFEYFEKDFEVFNHPLSPETLSGNLAHPLLAQESQAQGDSPLPEDMGIQRKLWVGLLSIMESQVGDQAPKKNTLAKLPPLPSFLPPRPDHVDYKRKRDQRGPEAVEGGKGPLPKEAGHQRGGKQAKGPQTLVDKRAKSQIGVPAWTLALVLDEAPLPIDASIRNFQDGRAGYVADAVEQALLLPKDMIK